MTCCCSGLDICESKLNASYQIETVCHQICHHYLNSIAPVDISTGSFGYFGPFSMPESYMHNNISNNNIISNSNSNNDHVREIERVTGVC